MAIKNETRRNEILTCAYHLFSKYGYENVSLAQIAKEVNISKSLLQSYFYQKQRLVECMLVEILSVSFSYMDSMPWEYNDIFQKISDFDRLFFSATEKDDNFDRFVLSSIGQAELLDIWVEILSQWLKKLCSEDSFSYLELKRSLCFAMGGAMHLYQHKDELGIDYRFITEIDIKATLEMLGMEEDYIDKLHRKTELHSNDMDPIKLLEYCESKIIWFKN